jgi:hypothetical protein
MILTDGRIEEITEKVCDLVFERAETLGLDQCTVCPFTKYCSVGKTGFTEFFKKEVGIE